MALPIGVTVSYVYDGSNRRVGKKVNGGLTQGFLYRNALKPVVELDGSGNVVSRFVYGSSPLVPDYVVKGGTTYRIFSDQIGSPRVIVDVSSGSVVERIDYDERGNVTKDTNPGFIPFGFAGGIVDSLTGLIQYGARDYDPKTGRWTSKDASRFGGGANFYGYGGGDPVNYVDPTGHIFWYVAAAGAFAAADLAFQLGSNGGNLDCVDWWQVAEAGLMGLGFGEFAAEAFAVEAGEALAGAEAAEAEAASTAGEAEEAEACAGGSCEGPDGCFSAETVVATSVGEKAIADVKVGDLIWSKNETTGEVALHEVTKRFVTPGEALLDLDIESDDGTSELVRATPTHRFWVDGQGWRFAGDLRSGDRFDLRSGQNATFVRAEREADLATVFNLEIEDAHSYFVGEDGVWVHNGCSEPVGRRGQNANWPNPDSPAPRNDPANIDGRDYSGHSVDRMQERGIPPSVVENTIQHGEGSEGIREGTTDFYDPANNVRVTTDTPTGRVVTLW